MIKKMKVGNRECSVIEVDFKTGVEEWSEYPLLDGGLIRVKNIVTAIGMAVDASGRAVYGDDGNPIYVVSSKTEVVFKG